MAGMCGLVGGGGGAAGALGTMFAAMADYGGASASWSGRGWNFGLRRRAEAAAPQPGVGGFAITAVARLDDRDALCDALGLPPLEGAPSVPRRVWREALADVAAVAQQEGLQVFHEPSNATQIVAQLREDLATPQLIHDAAEIPVQRRAVAHGVRALLSGWGGDEGVSHFGQGRNAALLLSGRWREFAALMRSAGVTSPYRAAADTLFVHFPYIDPRPFMRRLGMLSHGKPVMSREQFTNPAFARKTRPLADQSILRVGVRRSQLRKLQFGGLAMLGGERRPPRLGVPLPAAGPSPAGVRLGAAAGAVQAPGGETLADAPRAEPAAASPPLRHARPAAASVLAPKQRPSRRGSRPR